MQGFASTVFRGPDYEIDAVNGIHFIAMELLDGQTLDESLGGQPMSMSALVELGIQIADAGGE